MLIILTGMSYSCKIVRREGLWTELNAALKSMKLIKHGSCWSGHFSITWFRQKIWSWQERPFLKPAWFSLILSLSASLTFVSMIVENTFPSMLMRVMPRLLHRPWAFTIRYCTGGQLRSFSFIEMCDSLMDSDTVSLYTITTLFYSLV